MAVVCRDSRSSLLDGLVFKQAVASVLMAEALALHAAIGLAVSNRMQKVIFVSDCRILIQVLNKELSLPWQIAPVVQSIWIPTASFDLSNFVYVPRRVKRVADWVSTYSLNGQCPS
ncbi:hypothetical protein SLE2022_383580 [Rubroshorea leprosula]